MAAFPTPIPSPGAAAALLLAALALPACSRGTSCTAEVTEGNGTFRGTVWGKRSQADLKRDALRGACGQLCAAGDPSQSAGCVSRCTVDAEAGKIGARTSCKDGSSR